ncbi:MAG: imidazolonepropionase [Syntrophorhabdus sp. PtaU1.Bin050]|nr:MAG: imidazolonepropionase [Syntrophorhabdus sp. PtaU1.Bin050]
MRIVLENCRIIDGKGEEIPSGHVIVEGKRIETVSRGPVDGKTERDRIINLAGRTVLPGLIDCHVHLGWYGNPMQSVILGSDSTEILRMAQNAYRTLLAGVTTVRDMGAQNCLNIHLRDAVNSGVTLGSRICASGTLVCMTGGHGWHIGFEADGRAEVRKAVRKQLKAGADVVKLIATGGVLTLGVQPGDPQFTYEELLAGAEEAHKAGRKVASHVQGTEGLHNALKAGIDTIEHGVFIDDEAITMFLKSGAFLIPTLCAPHHILKNGVEKGIPPEIIEKAERIAAVHIASAEKAYRAGVTLAMGTDAGTPFNMHGENLKELELLRAIGMTPGELISAATSTAARVLGMEKEIGSLEAGKLADLIVVDEDPLQDICVLQNKDKIPVIMKDGQFYKMALNGTKATKLQEATV